MHRGVFQHNGWFSDRNSERPSDLFSFVAALVSFDFYLRQALEVNEMCCEVKASHLIFLERYISNKRRLSYRHHVLDSRSSSPNGACLEDVPQSSECTLVSRRQKTFQKHALVSHRIRSS